MAFKVYGGWNKNELIRQNSSSGGVFSAYAEDIINKGGVVYGACLTFEEGVPICRHEFCETIDDLKKIRGSKYTESNLSGIYQNVKNHLQEGRAVLFSGTPCQIGGLKSFLKKDYDNLITIDCICHGIPSKKLLEKYVKELSGDSKIIKSFEFRNKDNGWADYNLRIEFTDGSINMQIARDSAYMKLFFSDMFIRESCFRCQYKGLNRISDITIGDFWGVERFVDIPDGEMFKGVSVILCNSSKGRELTEALNDKLLLFETDEKIFDTTNIYLKSSAVRPFDKDLYKNIIDVRALEDTLQRILRHAKMRKMFGLVQKKLRTPPVYNKSKNKLPDEKWCYSCMVCESKCPKGAINMVEGTNGFKYPKVDKSKCVNCGLCLKHCPRIVF